MTDLPSWQRYKTWLCECPSIGLQLDISRMAFDDTFIESMTAPMAKALDAMAAIEGGAVANISEKRQVGHYWLRNPQLAPDAGVSREIETAIAGVKRFASDVLDGRVKAPNGDGFYVVLHIGIGGSALGPQLLADALGTPDDAMIIRFLDNTDPQGIARTLAELEESLPQTLVVVASKSGGTRETRNGMIEVQHAFRHAGLDFPRHAVAITGHDSLLDKQARGEGWLKTFPIWDFVGGRTSVTSACGLLPAALMGFDVDRFLEGARTCDELTRMREIRRNPAALLAMMWHCAGQGRGARDMVVLPYCDRLSLFGRYLQQLVMESLGKATDRSGRKVEQGLSVYGNKGSTDQHAYVQQLRDGANNFFVTFVQVLQQSGAGVRAAGTGVDQTGPDVEHAGPRVEVEPGVTSGDYLNGFYLGTRQALTENGRESIALTLDRLDAFTLGALIALFERAVGLYAELIDVNAYDQPGVEAGKKAAAGVLDLQRRIFACMGQFPSTGVLAEEVAAALAAHPDAGADVEGIAQILRHLAATGRIAITASADRSIVTAKYRQIDS